MKKLIILFLAIFISGNIYASEITDDYIDIAKNFLNIDKTAKANEYIDLILLLEPGNQKAITFRELTTPEIEDINKDKTIKITESPLTVTGQDKSSKLNNQGVEYFYQDDIEKAAKSFKKAIFANKKNHIAYFNLGLCQKALGKTLLAKCNFKLAHKINPQFSQPYVELANLSDFDQKIKYLYTAAEMGNRDAYFYLGEQYAELKKNVLAIQYFNEALIIEPNLAQAYLELAKSYYYIEEYELAIKNLKTYMTYISDDDYSHFLLGKAYFHLGYIPTGIKEIQKAIALCRKQEYLYELAKICYREQAYDIAIYVLENLLQSEENAKYYNFLGLCYFEKENTKTAAQYFKRALELDSKSATIYFNLSRCDKEHADEYIEKAKKISPENAKQYIDLAMMYYKISKPQLALYTINDAIRIYSDDKNLYKIKMKLCKLTGKTHEYEKTKAELLMKFGVK